ncbi:hypothetical protein ACLB1R_33390 [Escherichia coli]
MTTTATARDDAERFAGEAENSAQSSGTSRDESVDAAERARLYHNAASSAATSAENAANAGSGMKTAPLNTPDRLKPARMQVQTMRRKRNSTGMRRGEDTLMT